MKIVLLLCLSWLSIFGLNAQNIKLETNSQLLQRGEVYISFRREEVNSLKSELSALSFDKLETHRVYFYANRKGINQVRKLRLDYRLEPIPSMQYIVSMAKEMADLNNWDIYPTYAQYDSIMHAFAQDYPLLCKFHNLGVLPSGRKILAVQLGKSYGKASKPQFLYTATMHGDETTGYVLMLRLIDYMLKNYSTNATVNQLLDSVDIWINPLANPDGTYAGGNNTVNGATRYNGNSIDLNRNYPDPAHGPHPDGNIYQPETVVFMHLADSIHFTMSANLHGGKEVVNYPWDTWQRYPADSLWWITVSRQFADTAQSHSPNGYFSYRSGYTNGYEWYPISGGRQDYMNYFHHCREFTLELSNVKNPPSSQLPLYWNYLYPSFLNYIGEINYGLKGMITDSTTGKPLKAMLMILNYDKDSSEVFSTDSGFYFRPLPANTYTMEFSAPHYYSKIIRGVKIDADSLTYLNVHLKADPTAVFSASHNEISFGVYPNPADEKINIYSNNKISEVQLLDALGNRINSFVPSNPYSIHIITSNLKAGIYIIHVKINNANYSKKIIIE